MRPASHAGHPDRRGRRGERRAASARQAYGSLERSFAACGLIAAAGTVGGAMLTLQGHGLVPVLGVAALALLLCVVLANPAMDRLIQFQRGEVARVYVNAIEAPRRAVFERRGSAPTRMQVLRLAMTDLTAGLRMTVFGGDRLRLWALSMRRALDDRAEISKALAAALSEDAHAIAASALAARRAEAEIGAEISALFDQAGRAVPATAPLADEAASLQVCVRETTAQLRQAAALAANLADNAMNAQHGVAAMSDAAQALLGAAGEVEAVWRQAGAAGPHAAAGGEALDLLMAAARGLREDAAAMDRAMAVIGDGVQAHGALGQALSDAVARQMEDVARIVATAGEARSEVLALQHRATSMERRGPALGGSPAARGALERLPAHAEAVARILRDLPEFEPR